MQRCAKGTLAHPDSRDALDTLPAPPGLGPLLVVGVDGVLPLRRRLARQHGLVGDAVARDEQEIRLHRHIVLTVCERQTTDEDLRD